MEDQPLFSIIIPTYNRAALLQKAIESVQEQIFKNWELIIIDDGSTDHTKELVKKINSTKIKYIYQQNQRLSAARNTGVKHSQGKYICFLDDDDYYSKDHLFNFHNWLEENSYPSVILRSAFNFVTKKGIIKGPFYKEREHKNPVNFAAFNFCGSVTLCIPKECFQADLFLPGAEPWEDTHLMLRIFSKYKFVQLPHYTYMYVRHSVMGSIKLYTEQDTIKMVAQNINSMRHFFRNYKDLVVDFIPSYTERYIVSEKYSQHAFNSVLFGKYKLGWKFFLMGIKEDKGYFQWKQYLKFLALIPIKVIFNYPKVKFTDSDSEKKKT